MISPEQYVADGHWSRVPGATSQENLEFLLTVGRLQEVLGVHGDLGEIGVYLGRYFILAHLLSRSTENVLAIDVFDDLDKNFDATGGAPTLDIFRQNLQKNVTANALERLRIVKGDSLYLNPADIRSHMACSGLRILSIDGAHSWFHTASDLGLADSLISSGGVVILDDILNGGWPGVMDGLARYLLLSPKRRLFPFMIANNKVWLTTPDHHERYITHALSDSIRLLPGQSKRVSEFFGSKVVGF
jgi:hypothetical protein